MSYTFLIIDNSKAYHYHCNDEPSFLKALKEYITEKEKIYNNKLILHKSK